MKSVSDVFSKQGVLSNLIEGFQYRPEQESMAQAIWDAVEKGEDLICEAGTGTGKTFPGEGILNLARPFIESGCNSAIVTRWNIDDRSTAEFVGRFYAYIKSGESTIDALNS